MAAFSSSSSAAWVVHQDPYFFYGLDTVQHGHFGAF